MSSLLYPVEVENFNAAIECHDFHSGDMLRRHNDEVVNSATLDHPDGASGNCLEFDGCAFALISDTEGFRRKRDRERVSLALGADLIVYDATFTENEILSRPGWRHSTWEHGIRLANEAGAKQLC